MLTGPGTAWREETYDIARVPGGAASIGRGGGEVCLLSEAQMYYGLFSFVN